MAVSQWLGSSSVWLEREGWPRDMWLWDCPNGLVSRERVFSLRASSSSGGTGVVQKILQG